MGKLVYLSLGSNEGDQFSILDKSIEQVQLKCGELIKQSNYFETEPLGFTADTNFINLCILIKTQLSPLELLKQTQEIEKQLGRQTKTTTEYTSRPIDIDIILFENTSIKTSELEIPHPRYTQRQFVLRPLAEISTNTSKSITKEKIEDYILNCKDKSVPKLIKRS